MSKKTNKNNLPTLYKKTSAAINTRMNDLLEGNISVDDLEISCGVSWVKHRRPDDPTPDHAILAQAILDNNPGSAFTDKTFPFLRSMLSSGTITKAQKNYLVTLGTKLL
jgi:hypothetical protein